MLWLDVAYCGSPYKNKMMNLKGLSHPLITFSQTIYCLWLIWTNWNYKMWGLGCTNLELGDWQRSVVLVQRDEDKKSWDCAVFLLLSQWGHIHKHLNLHGPVAGEREPPSYCHHTAWGGKVKVRKHFKTTFDFVVVFAVSTLLCPPNRFVLQ